LLAAVAAPRRRRSSPGRNSPSKDDLAVGARRDAGQGDKVDCHRHHKTLGIVGMFADQVHAAWRTKIAGSAWKRARCMNGKLEDHAYSSILEKLELRTRDQQSSANRRIHRSQTRDHGPVRPGSLREPSSARWRHNSAWFRADPAIHRCRSTVPVRRGGGSKLTRRRTPAFGRSSTHQFSAAVSGRQRACRP